MTYDNRERSPPKNVIYSLTIQLATTETLRYYNALLVESTQKKVDLESRHVLQGSR